MSKRARPQSQSSRRPYKKARGRYAWGPHKKPSGVPSRMIRNNMVLAKMAEKKYVDDARTLTAVASTAAWDNNNTAKEIGVIKQGTGDYQRIGRKVVAVNLRLRGLLAAKPADLTQAASYQSARVIVYIDHQNNGSSADPSETDLLESQVVSPTTQALVTENDPSRRLCGYLNLENQDRFTILYDKIHSFGHQGPTASLWPAQQRLVKVNKRCNVPLEYKSTGGLSTDLASNCFKIAVMKDATTSAEVTFEYWARVRYMDN